MRAALVVIAVAAMAFAAGCSMTSKATDFSGLTTPDGAATHLNTTNVDIELLFSKPLVGDASLQTTVATMTQEAKAGGATKVRIVQSNRHVLWYILPPISFVVHPTITNVAADALK